MMDTFLTAAWNWLSGHFNALVLFGLIGQMLFMMRFVAQWLYSEKVGRSAVPEVFWFFSIGGGVVLLVYAILKNDFVFIVGQALGLFIYARNIFFIHKTKARRKATPASDTLNELAEHTSALIAKGEQLSKAEAKAASEALLILQASKK